MSSIEAISFDEVECGKKVAESKKRFKWRFKINGKSYMMELANSALSGKRVVTLNDIEIYNEKDILNYNFNFSHIIEGHSLRISRTPDNINKFQMRIDNQNFEELIGKGKFGAQEEKVSAYKKSHNDPFSQFGNFVGNANPQTKNNDFGDFDFDTFPTSSKTNSQTTQPAPSKTTAQNNFDPFGFSQPPKPTTTTYEEVNFQTNNFQTNNFGNFFQNFNKVDSNLIDEDSFATNTFGKNNLYSDLMFQKPEQKSENFGVPPKTEEKESPFGNFKIEMSAKQVLNKVKMTAAEIKGKIMGQDESLI